MLQQLVAHCAGRVDLHPVHQHFQSLAVVAHIFVMHGQQLVTVGWHVGAFASCNSLLWRNRINKTRLPQGVVTSSMRANTMLIVNGSEQAAQLIWQIVGRLHQLPHLCSTLQPDFKASSALSGRGV
jgi:hypothetical protein